VRRHRQTVIVGAGQAGLALSRCLTELGHDHVVLDRGRVAERWRSARWDSFRLLTPAWHTRLPGHRYAGPDPDAFLPRSEVVRLFESYARSFEAPVRTDTVVRRVSRAGDGWRVTTDDADLLASDVVLATGPHDRPYVPPLAADVPRGVVHLHAAGYRNPAQLPAGGVLVVGAGPTGQQLASELARSGRDVVLAVGRHAHVPRRYRDRDAFWWLERTGLADRTLDELTDPARPRPGHVVLAAGRDLHLGVLVDEGVQPVGRLLRFDGTAAVFDDGVPDRFVEAERAACRFMDAADAVARREQLSVSEAAPRPAPLAPSWAHDAPQRVDLRRRGITSVLWATGFRTGLPQLVDAPVFDAHGGLVHRRGVTAVPGLHALGLTWLYRRKSASIDGVGDDARYLADVLTGRLVAEPLGLGGAAPRLDAEVGGRGRRAG
jgi:putative flavoprotein involved in K+ transport